MALGFLDQGNDLARRIFDFDEAPADAEVDDEAPADESPAPTSARMRRAASTRTAAPDTRVKRDTSEAVVL